MNKKIIIVLLIVLAFVGGYLLPRPNSLNQNQEYKAGNYKIWFRSYRGKGGKTYQKIDIVGKQDLKGAIYQNGATIEEK